MYWIHKILLCVCTHRIHDRNVSKLVPVENISCIIICVHTQLWHPNMLAVYLRSEPWKLWDRPPKQRWCCRSPSKGVGPLLLPWDQPFFHRAILNWRRWEVSAVPKQTDLGIQLGTWIQTQCPLPKTSLIPWYCTSTGWLRRGSIWD